MGTRFTSDEKWSDSWFMDLNPLQKIVFIYIIENCNLAGFYEVNSRLMSFQIGVSQDEILGAIKGLNRGCLEADGWIWIKNFLRHQKNLNLNPENNAHKHIINLIRCQLDRFDDVPEFKEFLGANQGLFSPIGKGSVEVEVKVNRGGVGENCLNLEQKRELFIGTFDIENFPQNEKQSYENMIRAITERYDQLLFFKKPLRLRELYELCRKYSVKTVMDVVTAVDNKIGITETNRDAKSTVEGWINYRKK